MRINTLHPSTRSTPTLLLAGASALLALAACSAQTGDGDGSKPADLDRQPGATSFISADGYQGEESARSAAPGTDGNMAADADGTAGGGAERTIEEGDIYRVLQNGIIANLNAYRGLQLIDFSDLSNPTIIGRLQVSGYPVEMYVDDTTAFVLLNNWYGYLRGFETNDVEAWYGGVALAIDISDKANPVLLDRALIPGNITTSRLARQGNKSSLYVVTGGYSEWEAGIWETRTVVKSFNTSNNMLEPRTELNLGGYVQDIYATPQALAVARYDWNGGDGSLVSLIDISNPTGVLYEGAQIQVAGFVESQFNMDLYNGVLRVVSGAWWSGTRTNHLQTYDATDFKNLVEIDHDTFGSGEQLYATLFRGNKAFFVTYQRVDPFHAFSITDGGIATEESQFIVSGWNDFLRAAFNDTRLIGIGTNDQAGRTMSVSLYDITDLTNTNPLLARADLDMDYSYSEASWDHRAFSVIENAVDAVGPNGEQETGMVLLPYQGYDSNWQSYVSAVQIFTFSATSLTLRDTMVQGTPVRRSFAAAAGTTANLSEAELSLFDTNNPDNAVELGRVELAPNYADYMIYGDHGARVKYNSDYYYWWGSQQELPDNNVEIVGRAGDPDTAAAVASIDIPYDAKVYQSGDYLVSVSTRIVDSSLYPYTYNASVSVYNLSTPQSPNHSGDLSNDRLRPYYDYYGYMDGPMRGGVADCFDCGGGWGYWGGGNAPKAVQSITGGLAFLQTYPQQELLGNEHICYTSASGYSCTASACGYYTGNRTCRSLDNGPTSCSGEIEFCSYDASGGIDWNNCHPVDPASIQTDTYCYDYDRYRYWQSYGLEVLDLDNASGPIFAPSIDLPVENEGVGMVADGAAVWLSYRRPEQLPGDARDYVRYYVRRIDLSTPSAPVMGPEINVPGELLAIDGTTLFTRDLLWGAEVAETAIARAHLVGNLAVLDATQRFTGKYIGKVMLDGAEHIVATGSNLYPSDDYRSRLFVIGAPSSSAALTLLSETPLNLWGDLSTAEAGRAFFTVGGGALVYNLADPSAPVPQAFFPTRSWGAKLVVDGNDLIMPAGRFGVYKFDVNTTNLIEAAAP